ncbi:sulfotransferase family protein [Streptomyces aurantiacus]|nr:sulfotransferase family protein [Streptomyces aurantiacus]
MATASSTAHSDGRDGGPVRNAHTRLAARLSDCYDTRLVLVSPPRTGSTPVARLLWQHSALTHHCHEPFEASYWGDGRDGGVTASLSTPMRVADGRRVPLADVPSGAGLLLKEMSFQLDADQFHYLAALRTAPLVFVIRNPVLSTTSRLRIVRELYGRDTFRAFESGWQSVDEQIRLCRTHEIPYVIVDSDDLRKEPVAVGQALFKALGLPWEAGTEEWEPRPGMQLVSPEVGSLMSEKRQADDPFYRRVLSSKGIQSADAVDWHEQDALIAKAGLTDHVAVWKETHARLRADPRLIGLP